jgi:hypothetical protein
MKQLDWFVFNEQEKIFYKFDMSLYDLKQVHKQ